MRALLVAALLLGSTAACQGARSCPHLPEPRSGEVRLDLGTGAQDSSVARPETQPTARPRPQTLGVVRGVRVEIGRDGQLRGLRASDGHPLWNARLEHRLLTDDAVLSASQIIGVGDQYDPDAERPPAAYAVETGSGALLWKRPLPARQRTQLLLAGPLVLVGLTPVAYSDRASVIALDRRTGEVRWDTALAYGGVQAMGVSNGELVVTAADQRIGCA